MSFICSTKGVRYMKYTIISNCCGGADVYVRNGSKFTNPFVWSEVFEDDLIRLIQHFPSIDFTDYDLVRKENTIFGVNVSQEFTIWFPHYKYDKTCNTPTKKGFDIYYNKNYEYVITKYIERVERMTEEYTPFFLIFAYKDKIKNEDSCKRIQALLENSIYESILFSPYNIQGTEKNKIIYEPSMLCEPAPTPGVYVEKYNLPKTITNL